MIEYHKISVDDCVATEVVRLYQRLDHARGGQYGTWHSQRMNHNPFEWFESTYSQVQQALGSLTIDQWWFNCGGPGDENRWHSHSPYKWAGVLYIQISNMAGAIEFKKNGSFQVFNPEIGDLLLFPGNLAHRVRKNLSTEHRISAAFNLAPRR